MARSPTRRPPHWSGRRRRLAHGFTARLMLCPRRRAYTLFVRTYDEVRRLVAYFRWEEGDADEVAPSLFAGRARRKDEEDEIVPVTPTNGAAPVEPGMPGGSPFLTS